MKPTLILLLAIPAISLANENSNNVHEETTLVIDGVQVTSRNLSNTILNSHKTLKRSKEESSVDVDIQTTEIFIVSQKEKFNSTKDQ